MTLGRTFGYSESIDTTKDISSQKTHLGNIMNALYAQADSLELGETTMNFALPTTRRILITSQTTEASAAPTRYEVPSGETITLQPKNQLMRIVSGSAWISWKAMNIPLIKEGRWFFTQDNFPAVILAQGESPLVFERHTVSSEK